MDFEKIKSEIEETEKLTSFFREEEQKDFEKGKKQSYPAYDGDLNQFNIRYKFLLPEDCKSIPEFLDRYYGDRKGQLVGIELGGPGCNLFSDLSGYFKKTAGFTLLNKDTLKKPSNHSVIEADVYQRRRKVETSDLGGYQEIEKWIKENGKADLIIESMGDGVFDVKNLHFFMSVIRWYKLLSKDGTMFIDLPHSASEFKIEDKNPFQAIREFELKYKDLFDIQQGGLRMMIRKKKDAPDSLEELFRLNHNEYLDPKTD